MSDTVIKIENLSKLYRLGEIGTGTISHNLNCWWQSLNKVPSSLRPPTGGEGMPKAGLPDLLVGVGQRIYNLYL